MPLFTSHRPRHAKPSKAAPTLAMGGMTAALGSLAVPAHAASTATESDFARLRACESSDNYRANTGNGYYGAYQFDLRTWHAQGYDGYPHQASPATQDEAAQELQSERGWAPWPTCSRRLGLGHDQARASRGGRRTALLAGARPAFTEVLSKAMVHGARADVKAWQGRMRARGWDIAVDGKFGPRSARVAARFAAEKGLHTPPGTVDHALWDAAWALPVT